MSAEAYHLANANYMILKLVVLIRKMMLLNDIVAFFVLLMWNFLSILLKFVLIDPFNIDLFNFRQFIYPKKQKCKLKHVFRNTVGNENCIAFEIWIIKYPVGFTLELKKEIHSALQFWPPLRCIKLVLKYEIVSLEIRVMANK